MDWKDIEVGDYISVKVNNVYNQQVLTGVVTNIRHFDSELDSMPDPINYFLYDKYYSIRIKTQETYDGHHFKEYVITSLFCTLTNIIKKGEISTMPLEIGKKYKVNIPQDYQRPQQQEFTGKLVEINLHNSLTHLIYSKELEENAKGHSGDNYTKYYGCWWCAPEWLTLVEEPTKETIKLEDIFNE